MTRAFINALAFMFIGFIIAVQQDELGNALIRSRLGLQGVLIFCVLMVLVNIFMMIWAMNKIETE